MKDIKEILASDMFIEDTVITIITIIAAMIIVWGRSN